jgi:hypothetical protein
MDPTAQNVGVGGALFLSALYMILKFKPWKNGGGEGNKSGDKSVDYWTNAIRQAVKEGMEDEFRARNEKIREIVRDELSRSRGA